MKRSEILDRMYNYINSKDDTLNTYEWLDQLLKVQEYAGMLPPKVTTFETCTNKKGKLLAYQKTEPKWEPEDCDCSYCTAGNGTDEHWVNDGCPSECLKK